MGQLVTPTTTGVTTHEPTSRSRRQLLRSAGALVGTSVVGSTAVIDQGAARRSAPKDFPMISTRGHFDPFGSRARHVTPTSYEGEGNWQRYTRAHHDELAVFVHGWRTDADANEDAQRAYDCLRGLRQQGYDETVVGYTWDSDRWWYYAVDIAVENGAKLATWIADHRDRGGDPVRLIAHSLGSQVVLSALAHLRVFGRSNAVRSVALVGAAVGNHVVSTDSVYGDAIEVATRRFSNYYSANDRVLQYLFRASMFTRALGYTGLADGHRSPTNYRELDVTHTVASHGDYYRPDVGCMAAVVRDC